MNAEEDELSLLDPDGSNFTSGRRFLLISEVQLLLAEKRTSLSVVRTGIAVAALPLSIMGLLIATSKMYDSAEVWHFLVPLVIVCVGIFFVGLYLMARGIHRIRTFDQQVARIRALDEDLSALLD